MNVQCYTVLPEAYEASIVRDYETVACLSAVYMIIKPNIV